MSDWLDDKLASFIPGYTDVRKQTDTKIGKGPQEQVFETCLVQTQEHWKPAYLIDTAENGDAVVFIPAAPTFNTGQVIMAPANSYKKMKIDSKEAECLFKKTWKRIDAFFRSCITLTTKRYFLITIVPEIKSYILLLCFANKMKSR